MFRMKSYSHHETSENETLDAHADPTRGEHMRIDEYVLRVSLYRAEQKSRVLGKKEKRQTAKFDQRSRTEDRKMYARTKWVLNKVHFTNS